MHLLSVVHDFICPKLDEKHRSVQIKNVLSDVDCNKDNVVSITDNNLTFQAVILNV